MIPPTDLINVSWKPCSRCGGAKEEGNCSSDAYWCYKYAKKMNIAYHQHECPHCQGHGLEPVEIENEMVEKLLKHGVINEYKHQVGVPFEIPIHQAFHSAVLVKFMKFLPIRAEGNKMWVVKILRKEDMDRFVEERRIANKNYRDWKKLRSEGVNLTYEEFLKRKPQ